MLWSLWKPENSPATNANGINYTTWETSIAEAERILKP